MGMLTGWTGRKWDAGRLERSTAPKGSSRMGLSTSCARQRPRPQAGHGFSHAVNSSFPHRNLKFSLVVSADWRTYSSLTGVLVDLIGASPDKPVLGKRLAVLVCTAWRAASREAARAKTGRVGEAFGTS